MSPPHPITVLLTADQMNKIQTPCQGLKHPLWYDPWLFLPLSLLPSVSPLLKSNNIAVFPFLKHTNSFLFQGLSTCYLLLLTQEGSNRLTHSHPLLHYFMDPYYPLDLQLNAAPSDRSSHLAGISKKQGLGMNAKWQLSPEIYFLCIAFYYTLQCFLFICSHPFNLSFPLEYKLRESRR